MRDLETPTERRRVHAKELRNELTELEARLACGTDTPEHTQVLRQKVEELKSQLEQLEETAGAK